MFSISEGLYRGFGYRLNFLETLLLYLSIYSIVQYLSETKNRANNSNISPVKPCGPLKRYPVLCHFAFNLSSFLSLLNPIQFWQILRQITGQIKLSVSGSPPNPSTFNQEVIYTLPFKEQFIVLQGGINKSTSHSWGLLTQRYAYDFAIIDHEGMSHHRKGTRCEEYYCYNKEIIAAADGLVVKCKDGIRNAPLVGSCLVDFLARDFTGNHIVIRHSQNEYSFYAHLVLNSISVAEGQKIKRGQVIGLCGHSGHSTEPHLHFHLQDRADFFNAYGLPIKFSNLKLNGKDVDGDIWLKTGDFTIPSI